MEPYSDITGVAMPTWSSDDSHAANGRRFLAVTDAPGDARSIKAIAE
jgi:hypothetical protein